VRWKKQPKGARKEGVTVAVRGWGGKRKKGGEGCIAGKHGSPGNGQKRRRKKKKRKSGVSQRGGGEEMLSRNKLDRQ